MVVLGRFFFIWEKKILVASSYKHCSCCVISTFELQQNVDIYSNRYSDTQMVITMLLTNYSLMGCNAGSNVHLFSVVVGSRRYTAFSLRSCLSRLGFIQRLGRYNQRSNDDTALWCLFWIWLKRMDHDWNHTESNIFLKNTFLKPMLTNV